MFACDRVVRIFLLASEGGMADLRVRGDHAKNNEARHSAYTQQENPLKRHVSSSFQTALLLAYFPDWRTPRKGRLRLRHRSLLRC